MNILLEGISAFSSPGGKIELSDKIIKFIPKHKTYIEGFAGGGAVFLTKTPSEIEILNDKDFQIYNAWKTLQANDKEKILRAAEKFDWKQDKNRIRKSWECKESGMHGFLNFIYGLRNSFSSGRYSIGVDSEKKVPKFIHGERVHDRLQNARIYNRDYKFLKRFDSKDTFFYFDPHYPGQWSRESIEGKFDLTEFVDFLKKLKGKFLVSMNKENKSFFENKGWDIKYVKRGQRFRSNQNSKIAEILIANYPIEKEYNEYTKKSSRKKNNKFHLEEFKKEGYNPEKLNDAQLRDDWRLVAAKYASMREGEKTEFENLDELYEFSNILLNEILKRGSKTLTFHPENMEDTTMYLLRESLRNIIETRIFLPAPHSELIFKDKKTEVVKVKRFAMGKFFILNDSIKSYGFIRFEEGEPGGLEDFEKRKEEHLITDEERERWWKGKRKFFFYKISDFIPLEKPVEDKAPRGAQTFWSGKKLRENFKEEFNFDPKEYEPELLAKLNDTELIEKHAALHDIWDEQTNELLLNAHLFVVTELKNRGLEHRFEDSLDMELIDKEMSINPNEHKPFKLSNIKKLFDTDFYLKDPFLQFVGGSVISGRGRDIDIWVNWDNNTGDKFSNRFLQQLRFRLNSFLPDGYKGNIHLIPEPNGKFTSCMPLARLKVEFIKPEEREVLKMSLKEQAGAASEDVKMQMEKSKEEDKIELFRFFLPQKPTRAALPETRMTVERYIGLFGDEDFPVYSSKKFDGMAIEMHVDKKSGKVKIWSDDGEDITDRLPLTIEALLQLDIDNAIFLAELEKWEIDLDANTARHLPREAVAGHIHRKDGEDDSELVSNIFSCVYFNGEDLHKTTEKNRQEILEKINFKQSTNEVPDLDKKLNLVPNLISNNKKELLINTKKVSEFTASEGDVGKKSSAEYYLDGNSREGWIKWHKNAVLFGKVIERHSTKVPTVFNYSYGIEIGDYKVQEDIDGLTLVGKSFNTEKKLDVGEMIAIEFETLNLVRSEIDDIVSVTAWVPRFIPIENVEEEVPQKIDDIDEVVMKAKKNGILQLKLITEEGITMYEALNTTDSKSFFATGSIYAPKEADRYFAFFQEWIHHEDDDFKRAVRKFLREEKRPLADYPLNYGIFVSHFRGKSAHLDFRRKQDGALEGETILNQPAGLIDEDVDTLEKGKKWNDVLLKSGKFTPDMDPNKKVVIVPKARQPLDWLNAREIKFEPGEVGATKYEPGVFITMDEGIVYPGVQKPYFQEFFLDMKKFKGRMVERVIGVRSEWEKPPKGIALQWQAWTNLKEQTPYILTQRGRERREDVPPDNVSWLPPEWEEKIPAEHVWWKQALRNSEKLKRIDAAYNYLIEAGEIHGKPIDLEKFQERKIRFILRYHWWMGAEVVRGMPASGSHWDILIDSDKGYLYEISLLDDPLRTDKVTGLKKINNTLTPTCEDNIEWLNFEGSIAPKDAKLRPVEVGSEIGVRRYLVKDSNNKVAETKETFAEFKKGQKAFLDQWDNIYTGNLIGTTYGNPNERIPAYIEIIDTGDVDIIEDTKDFMSFNFKGKKLKGNWILKAESPSSDIQIFSKNVLPFQEEINKFDELDLSEIKDPIKIKFRGRVYNIIPTRAGKLRLDTSF